MQKRNAESSDIREQIVRIPSGAGFLNGELMIPSGSSGVVLFAHDSGSSRHSPRNRSVARVIHEAGIGALLLDLLTAEEEAVDMYTRHLRFDVSLLADRLVDATRWIEEESYEPENQIGDRPLRVGFFGAGIGGGAALLAAASLGGSVGAVVSRGGRPDLAVEELPRVKSPTMLIVGGNDELVMKLNEESLAALRCKKELKIISNATSLFEEPGALEQVAHLAAEWFKEHLEAQPRASIATGGSNNS